MNRIKLGLIRSRIELDQILRVKTVLTLDLATHDIISCPLSSPVFFPVRPPHLWYYSTIFCCCFNLNDFNKISGCIGQLPVHNEFTLHDFIPYFPADDDFFGSATTSSPTLVTKFCPLIHILIFFKTQFLPLHFKKILSTWTTFLKISPSK